MEMLSPNNKVKSKTATDGFCSVSDKTVVLGSKEVNKSMKSITSQNSSTGQNTKESLFVVGDIVFISSALVGFDGMIVRDDRFINHAMFLARVKSISDLNGMFKYSVEISLCGNIGITLSLDECLLCPKELHYGVDELLLKMLPLSKDECKYDTIKLAIELARGV